MRPMEDLKQKASSDGSCDVSVRCTFGEIHQLNGPRTVPFIPRRLGLLVFSHWSTSRNVFGSIIPVDQWVMTGILAAG
jgi:hypothetical protein